MLLDDIGTNITLCKEPNGHILCSGMSGYGKTFLLNSLLKNNLVNDISTIIIDYSGSFSESELEKAQIRTGKKLKLIHTETDQFNLPVLSDADSGKNILAGILKESLRIRGYLNAKTLRQMCRFVCLDEYPNLVKVLAYAEEMLELSEDPTEIRRLDNLVSRLEFLLSLKGINIWHRPEIEISQKRSYIISLNNVSAETRQASVDFLLNILWYGVKNNLLPYRCVIIDECQYIDLHTGRVCADMLREGRKFGMSIYMATQSIRDRDPDEIENMMQAGNKIFFRPTEKESRTVAGLIGKPEEWSPVLRKLQIGQAVLKGNYFINGSPEKMQESIVVNIKK